MIRIRHIVAGPTRILFSGICLLTAVFVISGCSPLTAIKKTTRKITRDITGAGAKQKKTVALIAFGNKTRIPAAVFQKTLHRDLTAKLIDACPDAILIAPGDSAYPDFLANPPRQKNGELDNFSLAQSARKLGINAIVTGTLAGITTNQKMKGFMWFKSPLSMAQISVGVEVYDTETASKLLDERFVQETEMAEAESDSRGEARIEDSPAVAAALSRLVDPVGERICDEIARQPWKGFIISISKEKLVISSGRSTGIVPGDRLDVYDSSKVIEGAGGQRYFVPGLKTAEIQVTAVFPKRSEAVILSGTVAKEGSSVKPR